jgi:hypothetical protein
MTLMRASVFFVSTFWQHAAGKEEGAQNLKGLILIISWQDFLHKMY